MSSDRQDAHAVSDYPLFEVMALPAILVGLEGKVLRINEAARKWNELSRSGFLPDALGPKFGQIMRDAVARGRSLSEVVLSLSGQQMVVELNATSIPAERAILVTIHDITAQVAIGEQLEQARDEAVRASKLKSQFVANMSHEIRTPLNGIVGMLELLSLTQLTSQQDHFVQTGQQSAQLLLRLIEDILDFSRIEAGKVALKPEVVDLQSVINRSIRPSAIAAERKGLELLVSFDPNLPQRVMVDPNRLCQLVINLVGNATKFTETGHIAVRFSQSTTNSASGDLTLRVAVEDSGPGIDPAFHESIFEQFTQTDGTMSRRVGGSGLGLAICRNLVKLMGGSISLTSEVGKGSQFRFQVPVQAVPTVLRVDPAALRGGHVLLADSNPASRRVMSGMLRSWEMNLVSVGTAAKARASIVERSSMGDPFRFVIWDRRLGDVPQAPSAERCTLVMLPPSMAVGDATSQEVCHYLTKPITPSSLIEQLIECLEVSERSQENGQAQSAPKGAHHILVVDDNEINREVAKGMAESRGHQVWLARDGFEALEQLQQRVFDCVLLDIQMPGLTGIEVLDRFTKSGARSRPRFVAMTAHAMVGDRESYLEQGFDDYVAKPMTMASLAVALDEVTASATGDTARPAQTSFFEVNALLQRAGNKPERAIRMCEILFQQLGYHLRQIQNAIDDRHAADLALRAHALAGMIGNFGSPAESVARRMENMARTRNLNGAEALMAALEFEAAATEQALRAWVEEQQQE